MKDFAFEHPIITLLMVCAIAEAIGRLGCGCR